ncbi:MAG: hypothetical protein HYZ91_04210 [Candidatus Omnitrophica bacterium]|nr:hypothetical protein [Candidatus Omnitrophota bacterium]
MDLMTWFTSWLASHPLKEPPPASDRSRYTADVMEKINADDSLAPRLVPVRRWLPWPGRLALTAASAIAGVAVVIGLLRQPARDLEHIITPRPLMIAESPSEDAKWIEETIQLLDQLDDDLSDATAGNASDESWMEELERFDQDELAASS